MACNPEMLILISSYADGETTPEETTRAKEHLETCTECRKMVEEWQRERQLMEWAYTFELCDQVVVKGSKTNSAQGGIHVSVVETALPRRSTFRISWCVAWAKVGAFAAAASIITFTTYSFLNMPCKLNTKLATTWRTQNVRVANGINLKVSPNTLINRIDQHTIKLVNGRIMASVTHGTGFKVLSNRIEVLDMGTEFEVITGKKGDCVIVQKGKVTVKEGELSYDLKAGQVFTVQDGIDGSVGVLPSIARHDNDSSLDCTATIFSPIKCEELEVRAAFKQLASLFPEAKKCTWGMTGGEMLDQAWWLGVGNAAETAEGLNRHFSDIAQAYAGGETRSNWKLPAFFIYIYGAKQPVELPKDLYFVWLVSKDGKLAWRLCGSSGIEADVPVVFGSLDNKCNAGGNCSSIDCTSVDYSYDSRPDACELTVRLSDWPGDRKPALGLKLNSLPAEEADKAKFEACNELIRQVSGIDGLTLARPRSSLLYLDEEGKHRIYTAWNTKAGIQLCKLSDAIKRGIGGSVIIGAINVDVPLTEPKAKPGTYLLNMVASGKSKSPYIELVTPDMRKVATLTVVADRREGGYMIEQSAEPLPGYGILNFDLWANSEKNGSLSFGFRVMKDADRDPSKGYDAWAEGWIKIKKP